MFQTVPLSIIMSFSLYTQQWYMSYRFADSLQTDDGQRNCLKHVECYTKNKFEKLVHLVGFIIRNFHDAQSPEHQIRTYCLMKGCHHFKTGCDIRQETFS